MSKDNAYLNRVRSLPCVICEKYGRDQITPTEAHHCFHDRYSQAKVSDYDTIPLCRECHLGDWNPTIGIAIHKRKKEWRNQHGPDWSYIKQTRERANCPEDAEESYKS